MKKLFFVLTLFLSMVFAPFVFAVGIIQNAPSLPGYQTPVFESVALIVAADCRDVHEYIQKAVIIYTSTQSKSRPIILENALATFEKDETTFNHWEAVKRNGVGKVYLPMTANQNTKLDISAPAG